MLQMQTQPEQLKRQQALMKVYGFYNGAIDGIWGPASIAAKKAFEASPSFKPGYPNNGMPFKNTGPFPKGIRMQHGRIPMITCDGLEEVLREANQKAADLNNALAEREKSVVAGEEVESVEEIKQEVSGEPSALDLIKSVGDSTDTGRQSSKKKRRR